MQSLANKTQSDYFYANGSKGLSIATITDPFYSNVSLLLNMNGTNASTTFIDSSANNFTISAFNNAQINTTNKKFGSGSGYFDGNADYISIPNNNVFNFGTGDFTIEFWYLKAGTPQSFGRIFQTLDGDNIAGISISFDSQTDNIRCDISYTGSSQNISVSTIGTVSSILWRHFAIVRNGGTILYFQDGLQQTTSNISTNPIFYNAGTTFLIIGGQSSGTRSVNGYIDDFRVTKGIARYTSNFTPPTEQFPTR